MTLAPITSHTRERCKQRNIAKKDIITDLEKIKILPIYTHENGCTKYLDLDNLLVYYVRSGKIVTMIPTNPIQMLRYYAKGKNLDFKTLCRDAAFNNCKRGIQCKFIHL
tara:strand:- start:158 stop:484 length:327 start_codon:yes stop_codon:yes gene_type:complete